MLPRSIPDINLFAVAERRPGPAWTCEPGDGAEISRRRGPAARPCRAEMGCLGLSPNRWPAYRPLICAAGTNLCNRRSPHPFLTSVVPTATDENAHLPVELPMAAAFFLHSRERQGRSSGFGSSFPRALPQPILDLSSVHPSACRRSGGSSALRVAPQTATPPLLLRNAGPAPYLLFDLFFGTFLPAFRALERPMAIACFLLFTVLPDRPLLSLPLLRSCMAVPTSFDALFEYFRRTTVDHHRKCKQKSGYFTFSASEVLAGSPLAG